MSESIQTKLALRHQERLEKFEKRREQRLKEKSESSESSDLFLDKFNKEKRELIVILHSMNPKLTKLQLTNGFECISKKMLTLQKYISDSASFLPSFDIRRAQEILTQLRSDINNERDVLLPKKKFAFKSRQKLKSTEPVTDKTEVADGAVARHAVTSNDSNDFGFAHRIDEELTLSRCECNGKDVNLSNLENCVVYIYGCPSAVRVKNVINSSIYCGPVSRAVFVNDCIDCTFQVACQQLRIHSTSSTQFYIHVTSKAIIEDSDEVGFGCYSWSYEEIKDDFKESGLNKSVNNWKEIDDFNWLKLDEQSPNWYLLPKETFN